MTRKTNGLLLVANYDSAVGYAWWLMESYWAALARHYSPSHTIHLAYPSISSLPEVIRDAPLTTHILDFGQEDPAAVWRQMCFLRRHRIRCIYFSDRASRHWRYLAYRLAGVSSIIVHDHTPGVRTPPRGLKRLAKWVAQRIPGYRADGLIGATQFVRKRHIDVLCAPPDRCFAAPNGLPTASASPPLDLHAALGIPPERRVMVTTSRAHPYKGIDQVLELMHTLVIEQGHTDIHYLFCGDGPALRELLQTAHRLGIDQYTTMPGRRDDVPNILAACDFAIHPSHGEVGYSLSILEYMQAGLPVIVSDNPSVCEATTHDCDGLIYPEGDLNAARECVITLLENPKKAAALGRVVFIILCHFFNLPPKR